MYKMYIGLITPPKKSLTIVKVCYGNFASLISEKLSFQQMGRWGGSFAYTISLREAANKGAFLSCPTTKKGGG